jgi:hypothetical protein
MTPSPLRLFMLIQLSSCAGILAAASEVACAQDQVSVVTRPDTTQTNKYYISNRRPLLPSQFIPLPVGSVQVQGWVKTYLECQREGLTGHLPEISAWLQKQDNAWLSKDGKGK